MCEDSAATAAKPPNRKPPNCQEHVAANIPCQRQRSKRPARLAALNEAAEHLHLLQLRRLLGEQQLQVAKLTIAGAPTSCQSLWTLDSVSPRA